MRRAVTTIHAGGVVGIGFGGNRSIVRVAAIAVRFVLAHRHGRRRICRRTRSDVRIEAGSRALAMLCGDLIQG